MPRRAFVIVAVSIAVLLALAAALQVAIERLRGGVEQALGPQASVGALRAGLTGIEITGLRIRAERKGRTPWPADDELRATRVHVVPDIAGLLRGEMRVRSVVIDGGYVSMLRARDGRLHVLPSLLGRAASGDGAPGPRVHIGEVRVRGATVDFHDATVRQPPHRLRFEALDATLGPLVLPALDVPVELALAAAFKGAQRDGRVAITGRITPATRDASLQVRLAGVDLVALQPYLLRAGEGGVRRGSLDLELQAAVARERLHAPGRLTLVGVEFGPAGGALGTFAGVPRQAVLAAISRDGRVRVEFTLEGRLDDPKFSLNESFAVKVASGIAETLGVSVGGVVEGVGSVIRGLLGR